MGRSVFAASQQQDMWRRFLLDEVIVDIPDKIITVLIVFAILKGLPKKLTALYDVNETIESLD